VLGPFLLLQAIAVQAAVGGAADLNSTFGAPFGPDVQTPSAIPGFVGRLFGVAAIFTLLYVVIVLPFLTAATARATAEVYMGSAPTVGDVYRFALGKLGSVLWVTILTGLIAFGLIIAVGLVMAILGFVLPSPIDVVLMVLVGIAAFVAFVYVFLRLIFGTTTVVVEDRRGTDAIRRSWQLSAGFFWKILGMTILAGILAAIVGFIVRIPFFVLARLFGDAGWFVDGLGQAASQVVVNPFSLIIIVLLYFDMRIRKEAFDLTLMAQELDRPV
jgi:membrane-anchored glycerophosphoryl diester phosphodiesterase (GDPDase)